MSNQDNVVEICASKGYKSISVTESETNKYFLSIGGGMGGGNLTFYGEETSSTDNLINVEQVNGQEVTLGKNFIATINKVKLVTVVETDDVTGEVEVNMYALKMGKTVKVVKQSYDVANRMSQYSIFN